MLLRSASIHKRSVLPQLEDLPQAAAFITAIGVHFTRVLRLCLVRSQSRFIRPIV